MIQGTSWLKNLRNKINSLSVSGLIVETALPGYHDFLPMLNKELSRVRRFEHPLAIAVLRQNGAAVDKADKNKQKTNPQQTIYAQGNDIKPISKVEFINCGLIFKKSIRDIDMIAYDTKNHQFIISFPETNKDQAHHTIKRIKKLTGNRMADQFAFGLSEFPEYGLIIEDLIEHAVLACHSQIKNIHIHVCSST